MTGFRRNRKSLDNRTDGTLSRWTLFSYGETSQGANDIPALPPLTVNPLPNITTSFF